MCLGCKTLVCVKSQDIVDASAVQFASGWTPTKYAQTGPTLPGGVGRPGSANNTRSDGPLPTRFDRQVREQGQSVRWSSVRDDLTEAPETPDPDGSTARWECVRGWVAKASTRVTASSRQRLTPPPRAAFARALAAAAISNPVYANGPGRTVDSSTPPRTAAGKSMHSRGLWGD